MRIAAVILLALILAAHVFSQSPVPPIPASDSAVTSAPAPATSPAVAPAPKVNPPVQTPQQPQAPQVQPASQPTMPGSQAAEESIRIARAELERDGYKQSLEVYRKNFDLIIGAIITLQG
jgi:hypothetical protein